MDLDSPELQAQLAALADGTLDPKRRARLLAQIEGLPELALAAQRQQQAATMIASLAQAAAPPTLHRAVEEMVSSVPRRRRARPPRLRLAIAGGAMAAAIAVVVAIALSTGGSGTPTLSQAAALALRPATLPPPAQKSSGASELARSVDGIAFPYWQDSLGWRASGMRTDELDGRTVTTVYYIAGAATRGGAGRVGYAIVAGSALPLPSGGSELSANGTRFHLTSSRGASVLTWRRAGHTCILVARGVSDATLLRLASWD